MAATTPEPKARSVAERLRALKAYSDLQPRKRNMTGCMYISAELLSIAEAVEAELAAKEKMLHEMTRGRMERDARIAELEQMLKDGMVLIECDECGNGGRWICPNCKTVKVGEAP